MEAARTLHKQIYGDEGKHQHIIDTVNFITEQLNNYTLKNIAFSFNGGKDCTVLLHLLRLAIAAFPSQTKPLEGVATIYFISDNEFEPVLDFMYQSAKDYGFRIERISGSFKGGLAELIKTHSIKAIFMGQRRIDPHAGTLAKVAPTDPGWPPFIRVNPIIDWSYEQVWDFLRTFNLPYCKLYDQGYTSLGGTHNTVPNPYLYDEKTGGYLPAYRLTSEALERAGRFNKGEAAPTPQSVRKVKMETTADVSQEENAKGSASSSSPSSSSSSSSLSSSSSSASSVSTLQSSSRL